MYSNAASFALQPETLELIEANETDKPIPNPPNTWSAWTGWTECSVSCGGGRQSRTRECKTQGARELDCTGLAVAIRDCNTHHCPSKYLKEKREKGREKDSAFDSYNNSAMQLMVAGQNGQSSVSVVPPVTTGHRREHDPAPTQFLSTTGATAKVHIERARPASWSTAPSTASGSPGPNGATAHTHVVEGFRANRGSF